MRHLIACAVIAIGCERSAGKAPPKASDPPAAPGSMAPNLASTAAGIAATWVEPVDAAKTAHRVRFATFDKGAWTPPTTIAESAAIVANWADTPSVVQQANGTLVAHWAEKSAPDAYAYDVMLAQSTDGGGTWRAIGRAHDDRSPTEHGFVSLVAGNDTTTMIWLDGRDTPTGGPTRLRGKQLTTEGASDERVIDDRVCDCCSTSAAATDKGVIVAYRDRSGDETRDIATSRQTPDGWTSPASLASDAWKIAGCPVNGPSIAANSNAVVVAWFTLLDGAATVRVAFSSDGGATFGAASEIDAPRGTRAPLGRVDVVLDGADAIVTWLASDREVAQLLARRVSADGRRGDELVLAGTTAGRDSGFPRMTWMSPHELLVVWTDTGEPTRVRGLRFSASRVPRLSASQPPPTPTAPVAARLAIGGAAPAYEAVSSGGDPVRLQALRGSPVLLNVWATWCEPCRHELPILDEIRTRYAASGLRVVAANVDRDQSAEEIRTFVSRRKLGLELWLDRADRASQLFGVGSLPVTLLFDGTGTLVWRRDGAITSADPDLEAALQRVTAR